MRLVVVGFDCRFPGAPSASAYWDLIHTGRCAIDELPAERLNRELYFSPNKGELGKTYCTLGGIVPDAPRNSDLARFDPELLAQYDIPYRHFLGVVSGAFQRAGLDPSGAGGSASRIGLWVGHSRGSQLGARVAAPSFIEDTLRRLPGGSELDALKQSVVAEVRATSPKRQPGGAPFQTPSFGIALVPKVFGWRGPMMAVDAACASSFAALSQAALALRNGSCELAVVGGVSYSNLHSLILFSRAQAVSGAGSFPFDARADGFISSDGYAAILLTTPEHAAAMGAPILAEIKGIGVSSDGRGKSLWAPRKEGQVLAIERAWKAAGIDRARVQYIEAHATSTPLGDATELEALAQCFRDAHSPIPIGSVKANIGHARESAGLAGLVKVLLALEHREIPGSPYFENPQTGVDWQNAPFQIPTQPAPWPQPANGEPRCAAVNSFGFGGLNVHAVIQEYRPAPKSVAPARPDRKLAIVGRGCVFAGAFDVAAFDRLIASGVSAIRDVPRERWDASVSCDPTSTDPTWRSPIKLGGFITGYEFDWRKNKVPPVQVQHGDPLQFMLLDAADQALQQAGIEKLDRSKTAVIVGTIFSSEFINQLSRCLSHPEFEQMVLNKLPDAGPMLADLRRDLFNEITVLQDESGSFSASTLASRIARTFDLMGGAFSVDAGFASSKAAIESAARLLESGECDAVICAGAQRNMDVASYGALASMGVTAPPGEGCGVIVLKRIETARRDGDTILAEIDPTAPLASDSIASAIGFTLGASGMAAVLAATANRTPKVAFLFSGQGSQYPGMLQELCKENATARTTLEQCNQALAPDNFEDLAWNKGDGLGRDIVQTQLAMLCADVILYRVVIAMGVEPDVVAGHSYGDNPALVAAGCLTLEQAVRITRERARLLREHMGSGLLVAVNLPSDEALAAASKFGTAFLAIRNTARQTVIGGDANVIRAFAESTTSRILDVPLPFHTPLLEPVRAKLAAFLEHETIRPPRIPFLSGMTGRYVADPIDLREHIANLPVLPVDYQSVIERIAKELSPIFLEIGPKQVLTGLHKQILGRDAAAIATDHATMPSREVIARLQTFFQKHGVATTVGPAVISFDATRKRLDRNAKHAAIAPAAAPESDLTAFMVRFICEHTGYPAQMIDLDADLEADLGIDSIKKAQLLGELREKHGLRMPAGRRMTLADVPTLRSIVRLMQDVAPIVMLSGSHHDMGMQLGADRKEEIRGVMRSYFELLGKPDIEQSEALRLESQAVEMLGEKGCSELSGMAEAAGFSFRELLLYNALPTPASAVGCVQFVASAGPAILHGANEDSSLALHLRDVFRPHMQIRKPQDAIPYLMISVPGRVGGLNGMNAAGIAISSAVLLDRPLQGNDVAGLLLPVLVQKLLEEARTLEQALEMVRASRRTGAWSILISDGAARRGAQIEFDGEELSIREGLQEACANHCMLLQGAAEIPEHSRLRLERLQAMLRQEQTTASARAILRDRMDLGRGRVVPNPTMNTIRRVDNLYSVLFSPESGEAWWTYGPADDEHVEHFQMCELFPQVKAPYTRMILRAVESPSVARVPERIDVQGPVSISGGGAFSGVLARGLQRYGVDVVEEGSAVIPETLILLQGRGIPALTSGARRGAVDGRQVDGRQEDCRQENEVVDAMEVFQVVQGWMKHAKQPERLIALTAMDGALGFSGEIALPIGGAITGLLKGIQREYPALKVNIIDAPMDEPDDLLLNAVLAELASGDSNVECGYARGRRRVIKQIPEAARAVNGERPSGAWIVTGGARGITTLAARAIAERYGIALHLLGTTPLNAAGEKQNEIQTNLAWLHEHGIAAEYHVCDVARRENLDTVLQGIRTRGVAITGVLHGAGFELASSFEKKTAANVETTIRVKAGAAIHLMELTDGDPIRHFIAFGSMSGRGGGYGQADYSMASDYLAKLVSKYRQTRPETRAMTFHWPAWGGVGMAMRPESKLFFDAAGIDFLSPESGVAMLIAEIEAGLPEAEIAIGQATSGESPVALPLIERVIATTSSMLEAEVVLAPSHPLIRDHRWRGKSILPAAVSHEILLEALDRFAPGSIKTHAFSLRIENAVTIEDAPLRLRARVDGPRAVLFREFRNKSGVLIDSRRVAASLEATVRGQEPAIPEMPSDLEWHPLEYASEAETIEQDKVWFGPSLRALREIAFKPGKMFGKVVAPESAYLIAPPLLDACFVGCGAFCRKKLERAVLVHSMEGLSIGEQPDRDEACLVALNYLGAEDRLRDFELWLLRADGAVALHASRIRMVVTNSGRAEMNLGSAGLAARATDGVR